MSVSPTSKRRTDHSSNELRFVELEAGFKKYEELLKSIADHAKQLNEIKTKLVRFLCDF
jgi:hypothetical protein